MTKSYFADVELPMIGGTPQDNPHNTFSFLVPGSSVSTDLGSVKTAIQAFYNAVASGATNALAQYIADTVSRGVGAVLTKIYDVSGHLDGSPHGAPIGMDAWQLGPITGTATETSSLPEGVCIVDSFHQDYVTDTEFGVVVTTLPTDDRAQDEGAPATHTGRTRPRARDRGRLYLGPIAVKCMGQEVSTLRRNILPSVRTDIGKASEALISATGCNWSVWSRANASMSLVNGGWVDDRFDYQRRREDQGTVRTNW